MLSSPVLDFGVSTCWITETMEADTFGHLLCFDTPGLIAEFEWSFRDRDQPLDRRTKLSLQ